MDYELMMNNNLKIGMKAPNFEAQTTYGRISLEDYIGKWIILFSHPGDFTPVCTTEMIAFSNANNYFEKLNAKLIGLSVDSNPSHLAWMYDIYSRTGIKITFPIIADQNGVIARKYGMISNNISNTETVRNVFIIDPEGIIKLILVYPMNVGRCIPEILRSLEALQTAEKYNGATPANWTFGGPIINAIPTNINQLEERINKIKEEKNGINWYLSFKDTKDDTEKKIDNICVKQIENKKDDYN